MKDLESGGARAPSMDHHKSKSKSKRNGEKERTHHTGKTLQNALVVT